VSDTTGAVYGDNPYLGPRSFQQNDHDRFFGRDREIRDLRSLWLANRLVVVFGYSGVGKSSLLRAGVIPTLPPDVDLLPVGSLTPTPTHAYMAGSEINPFLFVLLSSWWPTAKADELRGMSLREFFRRRGERRDDYGEPVPILAAVDQFEKLFTSSPHYWRHRDAFLDELTEVVEELPELRLLVSIRQDALAAFLPYEHRIAPPRRRFPLQALSPQAALEAVKGPLRATGRSYAPGVAEMIVDNLRTTRVTDERGGISRVPEELVEPVQLQIVCAGLWESLPDDVRVITAGHVERHGNVDETLAEFYDRVVAETAAEYRLTEDDLRSWIEKTFITEMGTRNTVYEGASSTSGMANEVPRALAERHLLKAEHRLGARWYELQHDRFIEPILRSNRSSSLPLEPGNNRDSGEWMLTAAEEAFAAGRFETAGKWARRAVNAAEERGDRRVQAEACFLLGRATGQLGDLEEAEQHFDEAIRIFRAIDDGSAVGRVLCGLGELLLEADQPQRAMRYFEEAARRLAGDPAPLEGLARALWQLDRLDAALDIYRQILRQFPTNTTALAGRGRVQAEMGRAAEAVPDLQAALRAEQDTAAVPPLHAALALALARLDRFEDARRELESALEPAPRDGRVLLYAAQVAELAGDFAAARDHLDQARQADAPRLLPHQERRAAEIERRLPAGG